jgi:hypothetical protein
MIKLIDILAEVGEGTAQKYNWSYSGKNASSDYDILNYDFKTDSGVNYFVTLVAGNEALNSINDFEMTVSFGVGNKGSLKSKVGIGKPSYTKVVNKGELFRVMATVVDIVKDGMERMKKEEKPIKYIIFKPEKEKETETGFKQSDQRLKLYLAYLKQNMDQIQSIEQGSGAVEVTLK